MSDQEPSQVSSRGSRPTDDLSLLWAADMEKFCPQWINPSFKVTDLQPSPE